jgi:cytochrome d ubiquinol oxidase subunit I
MFFSTLIPVLVNELGWLAAEFGRQPWIVYDLLKTEAASSPI